MNGCVMFFTPVRSCPLSILPQSIAFRLIGLLLQLRFALYLHPAQTIPVQLKRAVEVKGDVRAFFFFFFGLFIIQALCMPSIMPQQTTASKAWNEDTEKCMSTIQTLIANVESPFQQVFTFHVLYFWHR